MLMLIEVAYSLGSLMSAFCIIFQWKPCFGVLLGVVMQLLWIHYWVFTGQEGIILLDGGILLFCTIKYLKYGRKQ